MLDDFIGPFRRTSRILRIAKLKFKIPEMPAHLNAAKQCDSGVHVNLAERLIVAAEKLIVLMCKVQVGCDIRPVR